MNAVGDHGAGAHRGVPGRRGGDRARRTSLAGGLKLIPDFVVGGAGFGGSPTVDGDDRRRRHRQRGRDWRAPGDLARPRARSTRPRRWPPPRRPTSGARTSGDFQARLADRELAQIDQQIATAQLHLDMLDRGPRRARPADRQQRRRDADVPARPSTPTRSCTPGWSARSARSTSRRTSWPRHREEGRALLRLRAGPATTPSSRFGYWDSLKKGLMTGRRAAARPQADGGWRTSTATRASTS